MKTYVIGDIQGCYTAFLNLLSCIQFDPAQDYLWIAGDLVNRGAQSLAVLEHLYALRDRCVIVLGNHDLHLLALAEQIIPAKKSDTLQDVLASPNKKKLCDWLRHQKIAFYDDEKKIILTHAGIPPIWSLSETLSYAKEIETVLQSEQYVNFLNIFRGEQPDQWNPQYQGDERLRILTHYFTRMRFCDANGKLDLRAKEKIPAHADFKPWFTWPRKIESHITILFGHWAALDGKTSVENVICVDTGCVWGRELSAWCVEDRKWFSVGCGKSG